MLYFRHKQVRDIFILEKATVRIRTQSKLIVPGKDGGGILLTLALGIAGAFFSGWIGSFFGLGTTGGLSLSSVATATVAAFLLLFIYKKIKKTKS